MIDLQKVEFAAHEAHDSIGHRRKYSNDPYWVHLDETADMVRRFYPLNPEVTAATFFHDLLEDVFGKNPFYNAEWLEKNYGPKVKNLVVELTDVFTSEKYPELNRATRKALEAERLSKISAEAQSIKVCDLISNTASIAKHDSGFAKTYLKEKSVVLKGLTRAHPVLLDRAWKQLIEEGAKLGLDFARP